MIQSCIRMTLAAAGVALAGAAAAAESCPVTVESADALDAAGIAAVYDCLEARMAEGYAKSEEAAARAYRGWTVTGTRPAVAGPHGNRLLLTFANEIAAPGYLAFAEDGVAMPEGAVLAKESISINKKKQEARPGPLFLMTKLATGAAPETADWLYGGVQPNGKPMKFKQSFCHNCHQAFADQDYLAYPLQEVRVGQ